MPRKKAESLRDIKELLELEEAWKKINLFLQNDTSVDDSYVLDELRKNGFAEKMSKHLAVELKGESE